MRAGATQPAAARQCQTAAPLNTFVTLSTFQRQKPPGPQLREDGRSCVRSPRNSAQTGSCQAAVPLHSDYIAAAGGREADQLQPDIQIPLMLGIFTYLPSTFLFPLDCLCFLNLRAVTSDWQHRMIVWTKLCCMNIPIRSNSVAAASVCVLSCLKLKC